LSTDILIERRTLNGFQYMRAIATLGVVATHAVMEIGRMFYIGHACIHMFFVLSGFLMVYITRSNTRPLSFIAERLKRIVPLYWIATSVFLAGMFLGLFPKVPTDFSYILSSYLFIPAASPLDGKIVPLLIPGWTLNYEIYFYLMFTACLLIRNELKRLFALSVVLGILAALGFVLRPENPIIEAYTGPLLVEFVAGAWIGYIWKKRKGFSFNLGMPVTLISLGAMIAFGYTEPEKGHVFGFGIPAVFLVYGVLCLELKGSGIKEWSTLKFLGDASYSIYLWHLMAISATFKLIDMLNWNEWIVFSLCTVAGVAIGCLSYVWIEKPIIARLKPALRPTNA
jgi:exopolysaccharide production protein ExoZ